jgi:hypothetical protein
MQLLISNNFHVGFHPHRILCRQIKACDPLFNNKKAPETRGLKLMQIGEEFSAALVQKAFPALIKLLLKYAACLHLQQDTPERYILVLE